MQGENSTPFQPEEETTLLRVMFLMVSIHSLPRHVKEYREQFVKHMLTHSNKATWGYIHRTYLKFGWYKS